MNRIIVVSGGTSGMGKEVANLFRKNGDKVFAFGLNPDFKNKDEFVCDVTNEEKVKEFFEIIAKKCKKIDIFINSAGFGISGAAELANIDTVKKLFDVNYFGLLLCAKFALPLMDKNSKIINIGSCCGLFAMPYRIHYCASKSAVNMLSYGLRMELADTKIQVTTINPGDVKTPFIQNRIKNFETNERYNDKVENAQALVEKNNSKRMTVEYASAQIYKIVNKKHLKAMYIIGKKYKIFNFFVKIFPLNWFISVSDKIFGGHKTIKK